MKALVSSPVIYGTGFPARWPTQVGELAALGRDGRERSGRFVLSQRRTNSTSKDFLEASTRQCITFSAAVSLEETWLAADASRAAQADGV